MWIMTSSPESGIFAGQLGCGETGYDQGLEITFGEVCRTPSKGTFVHKTPGRNPNLHVRLQRWGLIASIPPRSSAMVSVLSTVDLVLRVHFR